MPRPLGKLYHVSPRVNRESIARLGVNPKFARGMRVTWWVPYGGIAWATKHVRARHRRVEVDVWSIGAGKVRNVKVVNYVGQSLFCIDGVRKATRRES